MYTQKLQQDSRVAVCMYGISKRFIVILPRHPIKIESDQSDQIHSWTA